MLRPIPVNEVEIPNLPKLSLDDSLLVSCYKDLTPKLTVNPDVKEFTKDEVIVWHQINSCYKRQHDLVEEVKKIMEVYHGFEQ